MVAFGIDIVPVDARWSPNSNCIFGNTSLDPMFEEIELCRAYRAEGLSLIEFAGTASLANAATEGDRTLAPLDKLAPCLIPWQFQRSLAVSSFQLTKTATDMSPSGS
jgi:hypothetical protein